MPHGSYRICRRCIMDTQDPDITFDEDGICNHCKWYEEKSRRRVLTGNQGQEKLNAIVHKIKSEGRGKEYDCVMGLSGGIDSSYLALVAKRLGLRPLLVHLDNGWNAEVSTNNIKRIVTELGFDLYTYVIDWNEFRELQKAFFRASVVDIEMLTDHAIKATILRVAIEQKLKYVLSGGNVVTEAIMPSSWTHSKSDLRNIKSIVSRHSDVRIKTYPTASTLRQWFLKYIYQIKTVTPLNYLDYDPRLALQELEEQVGFRPYGKKHTESIFTRFYQGYLLPKKFNIDKRKCHLSNLICGGFISREEAQHEMSKPSYEQSLLLQDVEFIKKKLEFSSSEFEEYMSTDARSHYEYASDQSLVSNLLRMKQRLSPAA